MEPPSEVVRSRTLGCLGRRSWHRGDVEFYPTHGIGNRFRRRHFHEERDRHRKQNERLPHLEHVAFPIASDNDVMTKLLRMNSLSRGRCSSKVLSLIASGDGRNCLRLSLCALFA